MPPGRPSAAAKAARAQNNATKTGDPKQIAGVGARGRQKTGPKGSFIADLPGMMYAFGDAETPNRDTVQVLEDVLVEYITDVCHTAHRVSTNRGKLRVEDLRYALRTPSRAKQLGRVDELYAMQVQIERVRKLDFATYAQEAKKAERSVGRPPKKPKVS